ncbi:hypothetical protein BaRGS_00034444 [Batillaria attramentaria]|uniref:WD repeat-containing protein 75 second beta-propeller domain-containing protein n=1 Tax=Batillaria attramentaria TaxID=370345 RepID=A0ABD0JH35_9CAEN
MAAPGDHMEDGQVILSLRAGSSLVKGQTAFSPDSKYLFCCAGLVVRVFNTFNGQCAQSLQGHRDVVTGLALNPNNKLQLFTCALDGVINQWDYLDGVLLKSYDCCLPLHGLLAVDISRNAVTVIAKRPQTTNCSVLRLKLKMGGKPKDPSSSGEENSTPDTKTDILIPSCSSDHRAVFTGDKRNPFTCVASHPTECCLATGHKNGNITFWWNYFSNDKRVTSSSHWHSLPVQTLAFTPEGSCLLSGGHECVLVKWQMNSEQREYLPRLGAPLCGIAPSPDGTLYATSHTDNVIQLITSNFHLNYAIRGLTRAHLGAENSNVIPAGLLCDPRTKALVTNGRPGHLQFYCMSTDTQLFNLDIVAQNYISSDSLQKPAAVTEVEHAAFDAGGDWLVTYERWDDGKMTPEHRLKFWHYNTKQQNYQLNTTIEHPHKKCVSCLQFRPYLTPQSAQDPMAVTSSEDGTFKLWALVTETQINRTVDKWTCDSVGFFRDHPAGKARFSEDGSVLAVVFGTSLTLWDPDTNVMKATLSDPTDRTHIKFVEFGGRTCSHLIVTATDSHLTVWNLISMSVHWRVPLSAAVLVSGGDLMAVLNMDRDLFVFSPNKWQPIYQHPHVSEHPIVDAIFLPQSSASNHVRGQLSWQQRAHLYLFDTHQQLFTLEYSSVIADRRKSRPQAKVHLQQTLPETPFSTLLGTNRTREEPSDGAGKPTGAAWHQQTSFVSEWLNTPAPNMPSVHKICGQFLESLLLKNKSSQQNGDDEGEQSEEETESSVMETDSS